MGLSKARPVILVLPVNSKGIQFMYKSMTLKVKENKQTKKLKRQICIFSVIALKELTINESNKDIPCQ